MDKKIIKEIISWIMVFVVAFVAAQLINHYIYSNFKIPSGSMENTIMTGDRVGGIHYLFSDPKRGDIVVFPFPDDEKVNFIKRVIGLPGETISGKDGLVYINGKPLKEPYVKEKINADFKPLKIPKGCYFMMGDNRNDSDDARFWKHHFVRRDKIIAKAIFKYPKFAWLNKNYFK